MTLRKVWMLVLVSVTVMAIAVNAIILAFLTDQYFSDYLTESYELHVDQIMTYTRDALINPNINQNQMHVELESHLIDPIIGIKLYDTEGNLIVSVDSDYHMNGTMGMMGSGMMSRTMTDSSEAVEQYDIVADGEKLGIMNITVHSVAENSFVARKFQGTLVLNSLVSIGIAIIIAFLIGLLISRSMGRSLKETEQLATDIQLGKDSSIRPSNIKEVNAIRDSLQDLSVRLKLKQKTRKSLVDQLVHQTRTPLTILKSHIEAIEDGVMDLDGSELKVFCNQVENITSIITDMGAMIEAEQASDDLRIETFEFGAAIRQILNGLKAQYNKKDIELLCMSDAKVHVETDKNLLSQSIYNLLTNAYKYTDSNGAVRVSYLTYDKKLVIKIQDTGRGIGPTEIDKIFRAYYRSNNALEEKGEGIGLYIVKESVARIGGTVEVVSELGVGSTFTVSIPLTYSKE
ncbi:Signal transduction histidine kinase [Petrocella atlantisensis]|uniref:histidine kinase n=1 Tax=Petrocella atlantisensis TaxID=2173034 RepID=A0A3P7P6Y8_9FIRM|nr:HAMP domain-containing sensor histidine kinase [Petrocella atlantisensis]VDN49290.1 Signal transduction histidine kinase [Petrocella atlantisensis]